MVPPDGQNFDRELASLVKVYESTNALPPAPDRQRARQSATEDEPVVAMVNLILRRAVLDGASDVHIVPQGDATRVRFRIDGELSDVALLPGVVRQGLVSRVKTLSKLKAVDTLHTQDGQLMVSVDGRMVDVRVSTLPTVGGEATLLRILDRDRALIDLAELGMLSSALREYREVIGGLGGMVLVAGPTGSGKTTTVYATMFAINTTKINIVSIEDPVEFVTPDFLQIQVNETQGVTFDGTLRAVLRDDPDAILLGEIRDRETARVAVRAAQSGHFVAATIHARDATSTLIRLVEMGIEWFLIADSLRAVVAQRLVRRICDGCKEPYDPSEADRVFIARHLEEKTTFFHGAGCDACAGTGYRGRMGVYEMLRVTPALAKLVGEGGAGADALRRRAIEDGMITLEDEALRLVRTDVTTVGEISRKVFLR